MDYIDIESARAMNGLRLVLNKGVPGPWSESAKAIFQIKRIDYVPAGLAPGEVSQTLQQWTGQNSAPVAAYNDEQPRSNWAEILLLAERLSPRPSFIPENEDERALMFGIAHALCGEDGLGWNRRLLSIKKRLDALISMQEPAPVETATLRKYVGAYTYGKIDTQRARDRIASIVQFMSRLADRMKREGRAYLVGDNLTAADIYWACFSNLIVPIPQDLCPMSDAYRARSTLDEPGVSAALSDTLLAHRDNIIRHTFKVPMDF